MSRKLLTGIALALVAVPVSVFALYSTPSALLKAMQKGVRQDVSYEAHMRAEDVYMSLWTKGSVEGKTRLGAKADLRITFGMAQNDRSSQVKTALRMVDGVIYMRITGVEGSLFEEEFMDVRQYVGKWYSLTIPDEEEEVLGVDQKKMEQLGWDVIDAIFSLTRVQDGTGSLYSLKLKRSAWKDIVPLIERAAKEQGEVIEKPSASELAQMRKAFNKLNIHIKVTTDAMDNITGTKSYAAYRDRGFSLVFTGLSTLRSAPIAVKAPANAESLDDALNPEKQLSDARNAQRRSDVNTILNAVYQYAIDNEADLPGNITTTPTEICRSKDSWGASDEVLNCTGYVDLNILTGVYLVHIPRDPLVSEGNGTGYRIFKRTDGRITVEATGEGDSPVISVTR